MKRLLPGAIALAVAFLTMGCHQPFIHSAEGPDGGRYVVGAYEADAAVWWCPPKGGTCQKMVLEVAE
ncbi:MAG: hypothetical protein JRI68_15395 [Deltaproteobacteria bacterium]|nr:hypothetical protein [Deltaproteobacteria bacterium]